jgi:acyl transferase domain-containing protein
VLKRLSDAQSDGDPILAVIRGSAVNHNGRGAGLMVPSSTAQEAVIRLALAEAGVKPEAVGFIEGQGTATLLGDSIELRTLAALFGKDRLHGQPLYVGSVKTNVGHLEVAAGMASLIKAVLALRHRAIPPNLHYQQPNPHLAWQGALQVPTHPLDAGKWAMSGWRRRFSISAVHVVLKKPFLSGTCADPDRPVHLLCLSHEPRQR